MLLLGESMDCIWVQFTEKMVVSCICLISTWLTILFLQILLYSVKYNVWCFFRWCMCPNRFVLPTPNANIVSFTLTNVHPYSLPSILFCRIESIGLLEIHGKFGCLQRKQIILVDNDGVKIKFILWGEQVLLANLFRLTPVLELRIPTWLTVQLWLYPCKSFSVWEAC